MGSLAYCLKVPASISFVSIEGYIFSLRQHSSRELRLLPEKKLSFRHRCSKLLQHPRQSADCCMVTGACPTCPSSPHTLAAVAAAAEGKLAALHCSWGH